MTINDVKNLLSANIITGHNKLSNEVHAACGSDMMGDVLAYIRNHAVLLTGLLDPQVITTAEMMGIVCIVFVRGKTPTDEMINLARDLNVPVLATNMRMFEACGLLYSGGLGPSLNVQQATA